HVYSVQALFRGVTNWYQSQDIENQVMAAPVISISSDTSEESVGSHAPRVILFGAIPAIIPVIPEVPVVPADPIVTPEVGTVSVVSPAGVLDLVDYSSSSDSDPSEDSLPPAPDLPLVSPFLCSDDTEADEFPLTPVVAPPGIRRRSATLVRPGEAIPFGRPYRTHLNGPRKLLTARKRVRPIPARRLAWRRVSHHSSDRHSSPDSSSSSAPSDHSLSEHTPPDTTDVDSSTPQRFVHRSLARTPRHSEAFRRWRSAPLSTPYPPTTSASSLGSSSKRLLDSSSPSSRPSCMRCRSHTASVPSPTHVSRSIAPTPADLLPPHKRFRDSYSPEDSGEEHMEVDTAVADVGISEGVVAHREDGVGMGFEIAASDVREDDEEFKAEASATDTREIVVDPLVIGDCSESSRGGIPDLKDTIYDIVHYMSEVRIDRITKIETTQRQLETSQMVASGERASLVKRIMSLRLEYLKVRAMLSIERDWIDSIHWHMTLLQEEFRQVRRYRDDTRGDLGVILFGVIPAIIPVTPEVPIVPSDPIVTPEVRAVPVVSPTMVLDLVDYSSSSDSDPSKDSLPPVPDLPLVSPFLCSDDSEGRRSPTASVPSPIHVSRSIAPTPADLLPPRKRFRDLYLPEDSGEEHMKVDIADAEAVADGRRKMSSFRQRLVAVKQDRDRFRIHCYGDSSESSRGGIPDLEDTIYDIFHYMSEVHIDRITEIETTQRQLV
ncbi:hypothetical protein Tco_0178816, partial [Tanacetum coccineum]